MLRWRVAQLLSFLLQYSCHATGELKLKMGTSEQEKEIKILLMFCCRALREKTSKQKRKPGIDAGGQELSKPIFAFQNPVLQCRVPREIPSPNTAFSALTSCTTTRKHKAIPKSCTHWPCLPDLMSLHLFKTDWIVDICFALTRAHIRTFLSGLTQVNKSNTNSFIFETFLLLESFTALQNDYISACKNQSAKYHMTML